MTEPHLIAPETVRDNAALEASVCPHMPDECLGQLPVREQTQIDAKPELYQPSNRAVFVFARTVPALAVAGSFAWPCDVQPPGVASGFVTPIKQSSVPT